jgi:hypothetical protein
MAFRISKRGASRLPRYLLFFFSIYLLPLHAAAPDNPVFVAQVPNPNDYSLFANSGWDGNWYVGYDNGWIKKLPAIPQGHYAHAYIGAKLGRMKTLPPEGRPPVFNPIPGEIWMAIASTPSWTGAQRYKLTATDDIPLDGSSEYAVENTGESEWFWTEVPLDAVSSAGENYLALWSPTPELISVSSAPVLAAAAGGKEINTWIAKSLQGEPPKDAGEALKTGISYFQPALAIKIIPEGPAHPMHVRMMAWQDGTVDHLKPVISCSVAGESIERVWMEYSAPSGDKGQGRWIRIGRSLWKTPYTFSLDQYNLPHGKIRLRMAAVNQWEEKAYSNSFEIEVNNIHAK